MGRKVDDGRAFIGTVPSGQVVNDGDLYRVSGLNGCAIDAKDTTQTDRSMGFEYSTEFVEEVKVPSALNPAVGDFLYWTTNDGTTFQKGDTHLRATPAAAGDGPCFFVTTTKDAAGYVQGRVINGAPAASLIPQADPGALTFTAVAGTANTTLQVLPDPADTPASADALRDDIVANLLPNLRNNFADLATQVNAIRTALVAAGLLA